MATIPHITLAAPANPGAVIFQRIAAFFAAPAAPLQLDVSAELGLVQRRLAALRGSAPTWHPLHLERVTRRTILEPLRRLLPVAGGAAAAWIREAMCELDDLDAPRGAGQALDRAIALVARAAAEVR